MDRIERIGPRTDGTPPVVGLLRRPPREERDRDGRRRPRERPVPPRAPRLEPADPGGHPEPGDGHVDIRV